MFDEPDEDGVGEDGVPDDDAADGVIAAAEGVPEITPVPAPIDFTEPGLEEDDADLRTPPVAVAETASIAAVAPAAGQERIDQLEQVAKALTAATITRDNGRLRRKVSASATGAALVGAVPRDPAAHRRARPVAGAGGHRVRGGRDGGGVRYRLRDARAQAHAPAGDGPRGAQAALGAREARRDLTRQRPRAFFNFRCRRVARLLLNKRSPQATEPSRLRGGRVRWLRSDCGCDRLARDGG